MQLRLPYGKTEREISLDHGVHLGIPKESHPCSASIEHALRNPFGTPPLHELARPGTTVTIVTSDITRPCPSDIIIPSILKELSRAGVQEDDVQVVFALGAHRPHTIEEQLNILSAAVAKQIHFIDSTPKDTVHVGTTRRGTPIDATRIVAEADLKIAVGNVEPHYFAGYSGGAKALVPGICSHRTIEQNHALMIHSQARACNLDGNPVRQDLEEGATLIGLDFIINVIVDPTGQIQATEAGHPVQAHRRLCQKLKTLRCIAFDAPADITLMSAGGYPKDINLYQSHKALETAALMTKPGGTLILVAQCPEGLGNTTFEEWILRHAHEEILARISQEFVLGGHKAAAIAKLLLRNPIYLISDLPDELVSTIGMIPFSSVEAALWSARQEQPQDADILVIPRGESIVPNFRCDDSSLGFSFEDPFKAH